MMYGIQMLLGLFFQRRYDTEESRWKAISAILDACVPEDKREHVEREMEHIRDDDLYQAFFAIPFSSLFGATVTLALGWAIHTFTA